MAGVTFVETLCETLKEGPWIPAYSFPSSDSIVGGAEEMKKSSL